MCVRVCCMSLVIFVSFQFLCDLFSAITEFSCSKPTIPQAKSENFATNTIKYHTEGNIEDPTKNIIGYLTENVSNSSSGNKDLKYQTSVLDGDITTKSEDISHIIKYPKANMVFHPSSEIEHYNNQAFLLEGSVMATSEYDPTEDVVSQFSSGRNAQAPMSTAKVIATTESEGNQRFAAAQRWAAEEGLYPVDVRGDGACLFRAVCRSDTGSEDGHSTLRRIAVDFMRSHQSEFAEFLTDNGDPDENLSFDSYLDKISQPTQQVGEFILNALAKVLNKRIKVFYADCLPRIYKPTADSDELDSLSIIYRGSLSSNNGHYMSLVKKA